MKLFSINSRAVSITALVALFACSSTHALAQSAVKLQKFEGAIDVSALGPTPFTLHGTASHLGRFTAHGEVEFLPGDEEGTLVGDGVVVFEAANGDLLVGVATWELDAEVNGLHTAHTHCSWRDSVEFSDGSTVFSTGRFAQKRPPGLVIIALINVLINLLLPAVQG